MAESSDKSSIGAGGGGGGDSAAAMLAGVLDAERTTTAPAGEQKPPTPDAGKGNGNPPPPPPPAAGEQKPPADSDLAKIINAAVEQATRPLVDKVGQLESGAGSREQQRHAEDVREDYMRSKMDDLPREIARKMMPATKDPAALAKAEQDLRAMFNQWFTQAHKKNAPNFGGPTGGLPPSAFQPTDNRNAQQLLADALDREPAPVARTLPGNR